MTVNQILMLLGGITAFFMLLATAAGYAWLHWRRQQAEKERAERSRADVERLCGATDKLSATVDLLAKNSERVTDAVALLTRNGEDLPALEKGLIKVSQELVAVMGEVRDQNRDFNENVAKLYGAIFAKDHNAYQEYSDREASQAYRAQELEDKGIPPEEARDRARQEFQQRNYTRSALGL